MRMYGSHIRPAYYKGINPGSAEINIIFIYHLSVYDGENEAGITLPLNEG